MGDDEVLFSVLLCFGDLASLPPPPLLLLFADEGDLDLDLLVGEEEEALTSVADLMGDLLPL